MLIPLTDTALSVGAFLGECRGDELVRSLERTIEMCGLLATYAVAVAGKPSRH